MFTGIVETIGEVLKVIKVGSNLELVVQSTVSKELRVDQSVAHNGVCLTVTKVVDDSYTVIVVDETLQKTSFKHIEIGTKLNLERSMVAGGRLDGHVVQGHVDQTGVCIQRSSKEGSYKYTFQYDRSISNNLTVEKGSICVNGISLTVIDSKEDTFSVEIIPYTFEHTTIKDIEVGDLVNLEFDILGKYLTKLFERQQRELPNS